MSDRAVCVWGSTFKASPRCAIKITIPRPAISGDTNGSDVYGGQQYGPLVDLEVPE